MTRAHHHRALACLALSLLVSRAFAADAAPSEKTSPLKERGVLRIVHPEGREDDEFFGSGTRLGFDREILEGFARLHGLRVELITVSSWENLIPSLLEHKADVAAGRFTITPARRERVEFTSEVFPTRHVVLTRKPKPSLLTRDELRAAKIATVKGSAVEEAILAAGVPRAQILYVQPLGAVAALKDGRANAVVENVENALRDSSEDAELQLGMYLGPPRSLAYAVRKDDTVLLKELNSYIETVRRTMWNRLVVKYFGERGLEILKTVRPQSP